MTSPATPVALAAAGSTMLPAQNSTYCDPGQTFYTYRNYAWLVGDGLSLLASLVVLAAGANE